MNLSLRIKLLLGFLSIALFVAAVGGVGAATARKVHQTIDEFTEHITPTIRYLGDIKTVAYQLTQPASDYVNLLTAEESDQRPELATVRAEFLIAQAQLQRGLSRYKHAATPQLEEHPLADEIEKTSIKLLDYAQQIVTTPSANPNRIELRKLEHHLLTLEHQLISYVDRAIELQLVTLNNKRALLSSFIAQATRYNWLIVAVLVLLSIALGLILADMLTRPIYKLQNSIQRFGKGALSERVKVRTNDEIGTLAKAFNTMAESLQASTVSRAYVNNIIECMGEALIVTDPNFKITMVNAATLHLLDYQTSELIGSDYRNLNAIPIAALNKIPPHVLRLPEHLYCKADGSNVPVALSITSLTECNGDLSGYVCVAHDLTEQKRANTEINRARDQMLHLETLASLGTMSATVAHRINQPLTSMLLFLQQSLRGLQSTACPPMVTNNLNDCLAEVRNVSKTVREILEYTRKKGPLTLTQIDIAKTFTKVISLLIDNATQANLKIILKGLDNLPLITANQDEIEQAFFIIIQNSIHAAPSHNHCQLVISGISNDSSIELRFSDTCSGIAPENLSQIFRPFFTTKGYGQGTGLGLSILEQIINHHNGTIAVESQVGVGTTFLISLPTQKCKD